MKLTQSLLVYILGLVLFGCATQESSQSVVNIDQMFVKKRHNFDSEIKKLEESFEKKFQRSMESDDLDLIALSDKIDENLVSAPAAQNLPQEKMPIKSNRSPASAVDRKSTKLKYFIENATVPMLRELLERSSFDLNQLTPEGDTWLIIALKAKRVDNARELIAHGANPKSPNAQGELPESFEGFDKIVKIDAQ